MQARTKAHLALLTVAIIYGLNYIIAKDVMNGFIQPRGFIFLRVGIAGLLFWILDLFSSERRKIDRADFGRIFLCGLFGIATNQILFFEGLSRATPISGSVIMTITPVLVLVMSALILKDPLNKLRILGIILGASGALWLILGKTNTSIFGTESQLGNLLIFLNASSYAIYLVIAKPLMIKYTPLQIIKWVFLCGFVFVFPLGIGQVIDAPWQTWTPTIYAETAFVVLATTFLAYLLNIFALQKLASTTVSIYIYLQPLVATLAALALGADVLTLRIVLAASLIFSGVYMVSYRRKTV